MDKEYHCPRCQNRNIIEYPDSIECPKCELEFDKKDLTLYDDDQILSLQEKSGFVNSFED